MAATKHHPQDALMRDNEVYFLRQTRCHLPDSTNEEVITEFII
jgi:hypothetical protein